MIVYLRNEFRKLTRRDVYLFGFVYVILTSILYLLGLLEKDFSISTNELLYYFSRIINSYSSFLFVCFIILITGKELSNNAFTNQMLTGIDQKKYLFSKYFFWSILGSILMIFEFIRVILLSLMFDVGLANLFESFSYIYMGLFFISLIYSSICAGATVFVFKNTLTSIIVVYFYLQIEAVFTHAFFIEKLGFDLFGHFPGQIINKLLKSDGLDMLISLSLIFIYSTLFYLLSRKRTAFIS